MLGAAKLIHSLVLESRAICRSNYGRSIFVGADPRWEPVLPVRTTAEIYMGIILARRWFRRCLRAALQFVVQIVNSMRPVVVSVQRPAGDTQVGGQSGLQILDIGYYLRVACAHCHLCSRGKVPRYGMII